MLIPLAFVFYTLCSVAGLSTANPIKNQASTLLSQARQSIRTENANEAFDLLCQAYGMDSGVSGLMKCFEDVFRLRIRLEQTRVGIGSNGSLTISKERMGLSSLLVDQQRHEEAATELRILIDELDFQDKEDVMSMRSKAASMLFRSQAAVCLWNNIVSDERELLSSLHEYFSSLGENENDGRHPLPPLHAFEALKWSCITLADATLIAKCYANQAIQTCNSKQRERLRSIPRHDASSVPFVKVSKSTPHIQNYRGGKRKVRLGYISPDFTGVHPLAFLMQDVFRLHNTNDFELFIYSLSNNEDDSPEVSKIKNATHNWKVFQQASSDEIAVSIVEDELDILIDLCGYTGTSKVSEIMARRVSPIQISYMGFPGSSGASYIDYLVCDPVVVPDIHEIRKHYSEYLIKMPHCYFVNSHQYLNTHGISRLGREEYGLPKDGFVFCCHSRPDKIDPYTFKSWLRALSKLRSQASTQKSKDSQAVIWLLKSGDEMETNLRQLAFEYGLPTEALVFSNIASRDEHLHRLSLADVFLDTPSYNAHTVGCDTLYAGVPMISLLLPDNDSKNTGDTCQDVRTDKLASRVGASLIKAANIPELVASDMVQYEEFMFRCVVDHDWYNNIKSRLNKQTRDLLPLFDTQRWVSNLEIGLLEVFRQQQLAKDDDAAVFRKCDIYIEDFDS